MLSFFIQAFEFLFRSVFDIAIFNFISRFIFQMARVNFYNPFSQLLLKVTDPLLAPARRYIPSIKSIDTACLMIIVMLTFLKLIVLSWIKYQQTPHIPGLLLWTMGDLSTAILYFFFFAVLAQTVIGWMANSNLHPLNSLLDQITRPLMRPVRRWLKPIGGFDLTPLPVMMGLQFFIILFAAPLTQMGQALALHS